LNKNGDISTCTLVSVVFDLVEQERRYQYMYVS